MTEFIFLRFPHDVRNIFWLSMLLICFVVGQPGFRAETYVAHALTRATPVPAAPSASSDVRPARHIRQARRYYQTAPSCRGQRNATGMDEDIMLHDMIRIRVEDPHRYVVNQRGEWIGDAGIALKGVAHNIWRSWTKATINQMMHREKIIQAREIWKGNM